MFRAHPMLTPSPSLPPSPPARKTALARFGLVVLASPVTHVLAGGIVLLLDALTGPFLMFPILFVLPVSFAAWFCSRWLGMVLAVALPIGRMGIAAFPEAAFPMGTVLANAGIRIAVLLFIAYLVSRAARAAELEHKVKVLQGLLPICGFCKRIRDEEQNWRQLEFYISQRSEANFTHSICPECAKKHYGDLFDDEQQSSQTAEQ